jgi:hypothetical protein
MPLQFDSRKDIDVWLDPEVPWGPVHEQLLERTFGIKQKRHKPPPLEFRPADPILAEKLASLKNATPPHMKTRNQSVPKLFFKIKKRHLEKESVEKEGP